MKDKKINVKVLAILKETDHVSGDKHVIRIVEWDKGTPRLEKRKFFKTASGEWRMSKSTGFHYEDWQFLKENWDKIDDLLGRDFDRDNKPRENKRR